VEEQVSKTMVNSNMGLVHLCAKRFVGKGVEYSDLCGAGSLGLIKAIRKFDKKKGVKFSTYAVPVILGEIRLLFRDGGFVKVSRSLKSLYIRALKAREEFFAKNEREPTISDLSKILKVDMEAVSQALNSSLSPLSLTSDDIFNNSSEFEIPTDPIEEDLADRISLKQVVKELRPEERTIIILRFFKRYTQTKTAEILGVTQTQISRKEKMILSRLRSKLVC
jgi:RNA polymerase sporulation-specific sigma factor